MAITKKRFSIYDCRFFLNWERSQEAPGRCGFNSLEVGMAAFAVASPTVEERLSVLERTNGLPSSSGLIDAVSEMDTKSA